MKYKNYIFFINTIRAIYHEANIINFKFLCIISFIISHRVWNFSLTFSSKITNTYITMYKSVCVWERERISYNYIFVLDVGPPQINFLVMPSSWKKYLVKWYHKTPLPHHMWVTTCCKWVIWWDNLIRYLLLKFHILHSNWDFILLIMCW